MGSFAKRKKNVNKGLESFGYLYSNSFLGELKEINFKKGSLDINVPILLIDDIDFCGFSDNPKCSFSKLKSSEFWLKREHEQDKSLVPLPEIQMIEEWIKQIN